MTAELLRRCVARGGGLFGWFSLSSCFGQPWQLKLLNTVFCTKLGSEIWLLSFENPNLPMQDAVMLTKSKPRNASLLRALTRQMMPDVVKVHHTWD